MIARRYLLDASAVLAMLQDEPGGREVQSLLDQAAIHGVNLAEVVTKLIQNGFSDLVPLLRRLEISVIGELDMEQAEACGRLHAATRSHGLSLGDCVCLSRAERDGLIAVTTERRWPEAVAGRGIQVLCVR